MFLAKCQNNGALPVVSGFELIHPRPPEIFDIGVEKIVGIVAWGVLKNGPENIETVTYVSQVGSSGRALDGERVLLRKSGYSYLPSFLHAP